MIGGAFTAVGTDLGPIALVLARVIRLRLCLGTASVFILTCGPALPLPLLSVTGCSSSLSLSIECLLCFLRRYIGVTKSRVPSGKPYNSSMPYFVIGSLLGSRLGVPCIRYSERPVLAQIRVSVKGSNKQ